ncbi:hypothetical protein D3C84_782970 [compost metagenome]
MPSASSFDTNSLGTRITPSPCTAACFRAMPLLAQKLAGFNSTATLSASRVKNHLRGEDERL